MPKNGKKGRRKAEGQRRRRGKGQGSAQGNCRRCRKHDVYVGNDIRPGAEERVCVFCKRGLLYGRLYLALCPRLDEYVIHCIREYIVPESLTMFQRRSEMTDAFWARIFTRSKHQRARYLGLLRQPRIWSRVQDYCVGVDPSAAPIPSPYRRVRDPRITRMIEEVEARLNPSGVDPSAAPISSPYRLLRDPSVTRMTEEMRARLNPPGVDPTRGPFFLVWGAQTVWKCQGRTCHFLHDDGVELRGVFRGGGHRLSGGHAEALPSTLRRRAASE